MKFFAGKNNMEIDRINTLISPANDVPVALHQISPPTAARRIFNHVLYVISFLAHGVSKGYDRFVVRDYGNSSAKLSRSLSSAARSGTTREASVTDARQAQPEVDLHTCSDGNSPSRHSAFAE